MEFRFWIEALESRKLAAKDVILNFLQDKLSIHDSDTILLMRTDDLDADVISDLVERGLVSSEDDDLMQAIKNGITIKDLIDRLADIKKPKDLPPHHNSSLGA